MCPNSPAAMGGRWSGSSMRLSLMSRRRLSSAGSAQASKLCGSKRACRLISASLPRQRQIRSGLMPMIE
jgi:hypothetical protein